jgi:hypothetical protein
VPPLVACDRPESMSVYWPGGLEPASVKRASKLLVERPRLEMQGPGANAQSNPGWQPQRVRFGLLAATVGSRSRARAEGSAHLGNFSLHLGVVRVRYQKKHELLRLLVPVQILHNVEHLIRARSHVKRTMRSNRRHCVAQIVRYACSLARQRRAEESGGTPL